MALPSRPWGQIGSVFLAITLGAGSGVALGSLAWPSGGTTITQGNGVTALPSPQERPHRLEPESPVAPPAEEAPITRMQQLDDQPSADARRSTYPYRVNKSGETFGSTADAASPSQEPDLILTVADSGEFGYYRAAELGERTDFDSPQDALEWQESYRPPVTLNVYESDGKTVLGVITLQP